MILMPSMEIAICQLNTHWSPAAMKMIAGKLADYLSEQDSTLRGSTMYRYHRTKNLGPGDLSRMLLLPDSDLYPDIPLEIVSAVFLRLF